MIPETFTLKEWIEIEKHNAGTRKRIEKFHRTGKFDDIDCENLINLPTGENTNAS